MSKRDNMTAREHLERSHLIAGGIYRWMWRVTIAVGTFIAASLLLELLK